MTSIDPFVSALQALCAREGGHDAVAKKIGANGQSLYQIVSERRLPSGNPKGVGPALRAKLTARFPDWLGNTDRQSGNALGLHGFTARDAHQSAPTLAQALEVVLDAMAQSTAKAELKQLLPMLVETNAAAYRARLGELLGQSLQKQPSIADKLLAIPSEVESPRLSQRATEK